MRIIAGTAGGRRIVAPEGRGTRPITDRAKEGIFNMLMSLGGVEDAVVIDLFAGSGSFGLECLSRGARHVTFVERNRTAAAVIQQNLDTLGLGDRATVWPTGVEAAVRSLDHVDLAFCDPPYADDVWAALLPTINAERLVGHASTPVELVDPWVEVKRRSYGRAHIVIADRVLDDSSPSSPGSPSSPTSMEETAPQN